MASMARVPTYDTFGLIARYGKDVAGAAVIAREDPGERPGDVELYTQETLEEEVTSLPTRPLGIHDDSELSLPGLQDKLLLIKLDEGWGRPIHGRPSTHILKVEDRKYPGMAAQEAACIRLARAADLTTIDATTAQIGGIPCLIVSRFDRQSVDGVTTRLHQEDSCQALGKDPDAGAGRGKYESAGGPTFAEIAGLLDRYAKDAQAELARLAGVAAFMVVIGNADAHGKNIALLHRVPGAVSLAPLYDTVPTALWTKLRSSAAMTINHRSDLTGVAIGDIVKEAERWPLDVGLARAAVESTLESVLGALASEQVPTDLAKLVRSRAKSLSGR
jgi:serine/threonine-protein kinase HipA